MFFSFQLVNFLRLCRDSEWAVRKACAEVFTSVSHAVTLNKRRSTLAATFHHLLRDESRWVQVAAFQSLGSFIATFGCQSPTNYDHQVLMDTEGVELAFRAEANCNTMMRYAPHNDTLNLVGSDEEEIDTGEDEVVETGEEVEEENDDREEASKTAQMLLDDITNEVEQMGLQDGKRVEGEEYNAFQFWRTPLPDLDLAENLTPPPLPTTDPPVAKESSYLNVICLFLILGIVTNEHF